MLCFENKGNQIIIIFVNFTVQRNYWTLPNSFLLDCLVYPISTTTVCLELHQSVYKICNTFYSHLSPHHRKSSCIILPINLCIFRKLNDSQEDSRQKEVLLVEQNLKLKSMDKNLKEQQMELRQKSLEVKSSKIFKWWLTTRKSLGRYRQYIAANSNFLIHLTRLKNNRFLINNIVQLTLRYK